jgi:ABC-type methionine transport system ATPase subunit
MITLDEVSKDYPIGKGNTVNAVRSVSLEINRGISSSGAVWLR